ncbi:MAG: hypothetical protein ACREF9_04355 [Opitutaceae bacterium]
MKATALLTGANAGVSALSHLRGEAPAARHAAKAATGAVVRNSIELRNDAAGDDYFFAFVRSDVIQPQRKYFLGNKPDDTWIGTTPTRGGRPLPDNVLWPIEMEYAQPDGMSGRHPFLDLPTIPAQHGHIKYVACDKYTAGCNLSHTFQDHQKDWDFLESKLREILTAARLTDAASDWDKVSAVANFCVQTRIEKKNRSRWMHPVDFCLHGANCLGAANTLVGFCSVLGLPARTISYAGHTTSEVLLDGKWRWVENTVATVQAMKARGPVQAVSFLDQLNDPASQVAGEELVNKYAEFNCVYDQERSPFLQFNHEAYTNWIFFGTLPYRYEPPRATSGMGSLREVSALYPEQKGVRYKCDRLPKVWLTPFRLPWSERPEYLTVDQDHGIRQEFYVPSGRPIKALTSLLVLAQAEFKFLHNVPRDGGDWYYKINEHKVYIRDLGGWNFRTDHAATGRNCLELSIRPEWLI